MTLDAGGNKIGEMKYYPFGETRDVTGTLGTDRRFTGQRQEDSGLGSLYDYNARIYSPVLGRFLSADTIVPDGKNPQAWNRYAYTLNNPTKYTDSSGHMVDDESDGIGLLGIFRAARESGVNDPLLAANEATKLFMLHPYYDHTNLPFEYLTDRETAELAKANVFSGLPQERSFQLTTAEIDDLALELQTKKHQAEVAAWGEGGAGVVLRKFFGPLGLVPAVYNKADALLSDNLRLWLLNEPGKTAKAQGLKEVDFIYRQGNGEVSLTCMQCIVSVTNDDGTVSQRPLQWVWSSGFSAGSVLLQTAIDHDKRYTK